MGGLPVTDSNFTIVDATIQEAIKCTYSTVPPSMFHLVSWSKTHLDILNISLDISILYYKIDIANFKFYHLMHIK